ncbi:MAG: terminase TerL endonuclease subunit [Patescibacteria group bacterium]
MKQKAAPKTADRATLYALAVVSGEIIAGPFVRGACQRHLNDLDHGHERGLFYDEHEAAEAIAFFEECLCLNGGQFEGLPFLLLPWQAFIIGSLFGWRREGAGFRRFRLAYIETGKGSGKSPIAAGIGIKGLVADNEERAEIYAAATFKAQAMVLFRDACAFVDQSPELQKRLKMSGIGENRWNIAYLATSSFFRVISSENKGHSGPRPHMYIADEVHEHRDGNVIGMLEKGFKFRQSPMGVEITNSGSDVTSFCFERHEMCRKISLGALENDDVFAYICALDEADIKDKNGEESESYLDNEAVWEKVNPSLPYGIPGYDYIRKEIKKAYGMPSQMATVKRLNFCQWVAADNPWLSGELWFGCQGEPDFDQELLKNRRCWGGLDLSSTQDLTAAAFVFEPCEDDPVWRLKVHFWIPGDDLMKKADHDHVPYDVWRDKGHLTALPGKAVNKSSVVKILNEISQTYNLQGIAYDRAKMKDMAEHAEKAGVSLCFGAWDKDKREWKFEHGDGIKMMPFGQESRSMDPAVSKFEGMLANKQILHDSNPVLTWCAANAVTFEDEDKNRKISKKRSTGRVDGIVAAVMACGVADEKDAGGKSVYDGLTKEEMVKRIAGL